MNSLGGGVGVGWGGKYLTQPIFLSEIQKVFGKNTISRHEFESKRIIPMLLIFSENDTRTT